MEGSYLYCHFTVMFESLTMNATVVFPFWSSSKSTIVVCASQNSQQQQQLQQLRQQLATRVTAPRPSPHTPPTHLSFHRIQVPVPVFSLHLQLLLSSLRITIQKSSCFLFICILPISISPSLSLSVAVSLSLGTHVAFFVYVLSFLRRLKACAVNQL